MNHLVICVFLIVPLLVKSDRSQDDCQENELFVNCGRCEATCWEPEIKCSPQCKPARCECLAEIGYVRAKHGHCVHLSQCPGPNIYSMDASRGGSANSFGDSRKKRQIGFYGGSRFSRQVRPYRPIFAVRGGWNGQVDEVKEYVSGNGIPRQAFSRRFIK